MSGWNLPQWAYRLDAELCDEVRKLHAENQRYREALEDIALASHPDLKNADTEYHNRRAREALNPGSTKVD
jgi:hypothetical protein